MWSFFDDQMTRWPDHPIYLSACSMHCASGPSVQIVVFG